MTAGLIYMRSAAVILVLSACGGAASTPGADEPHAATVAPVADDATRPDLVTPGFGLHPGEAMTFDVSLGGIVAGEAALAVGEPGEIDGTAAIVVTSHVGSVGAFRWVKEVDDDLTTTIAIDTGLPLTHVADTVFGEKRYHADNTFDGGLVDLAWTKGDTTLRHTHYDFDDVVAHDAHTAMAAMRTWEGADGEVRRMYLVGGRKIWQTDVTWGGRETIATELGNQATIRLDGVSTRVTPHLTVQNASKPPRTFSVWMTDDGDRAPVRVVAHTELGDVVIELTSYTRP